MKILIIEDEKKIADFIKRGLSEENYAAYTAYSGDKGLDMALENNYDLIILDLMLPGIDGISLCRELRKNNFKNPILMLTAKDRVEDKVKGLDSGANDYLTKPFAFEELLARIRALSRKDNSAQPTLLKNGDLQMDLLSHTVTRAGKKIDLTAKEFSLLEYLMRNAGKVVTRTMISEHVWDINFDTNTNVIDVFINYLRKKVDGENKKKMIRTIRGKGYVLETAD
ncbi:MAG: response regulator transcription factor [Elusimicrobia bacterium]|nr:response regulator transcription factor [Elusimicrobiota bacterium]